MRNLLYVTLGSCLLGVSGTIALAGDPVSYDVKAQEFEGCECNSVCPCVFSSDTTFGDCRAILVFSFTGSYGDSQLQDTPGVLVVTKSGHNMEATMGSWSGVVYTDAGATEIEKAAVHAIFNDMMGPAFANLESRSAPIQIARDGDTHELVLGDIARLKVHALKGAGGGLTVVKNAPSPIAFPEMVCAVADTHTYDDGTSSWSFAGRNAFIAEVALKK